MSRSKLAVVLLTALAGCTAEGASPDRPTDPDGGIIELGPVELNVTVDAVTQWASIPVHGNGPANGTLIYNTPGGGQFTHDLTAAGDFCVDVILQRGTVNKLRFEAIDSNGAFSDPVIVDVRQDGEPPEQPDVDPRTMYTNIAKLGTIENMTVWIEDGSVEALVDDDSTGSVSVRNDLNDLDWMVIEFNDRLPLQQIHIETTSDCPLESYKILLSDDQESTPPIIDGWTGDSYGDGWSMVANVTNGTSDQTILPAVSDPIARRMAIEFLSRDCGPAVGSGRHKITEIAAYGRRSDSPEPPRTDGGPSCPGGF